MKGIEIHYKDKTTKIAIQNGIITIDLFVNNGKSCMLVDGEARMYVGGVDYSECKKMIWYNSLPINIGDEFEINVTEIDESSEPFIVKDEKVNRSRTKLDFFHLLEDRLKKQGLI